MSSTAKRTANPRNTRAAAPMRFGAATLVVAMAAGGGVAAANQKTVTVEVDGQVRQVSLIYGGLDRVLDSAEVRLGAGDEVIAQDTVTDGDRIIVRTAKPVTLVVDGVRRELTTTAATVREMLAELPDLDGAAVDGGGRIPAEGVELTITTPKEIELADDGHVARLSLPAATVAEVLAMRGIELGPEDSVTPDPATEVVPGLRIAVSRLIEREIVEKVEVAPMEEVIEDPGMYEDEYEILEEGVPGEKKVTYKVTTRDGEELARDVVAEEPMREATATLVRRGTKARPAAPAAGYGVWDQLAQCESGGDWHIDNGNGFSGGLQFTDSTWAAYGGTEYAPRASQASREQQIAVAERVQAGQGWGAWPACSAQLGLS
ncbi:resuscitation-promoting factor [Corynebacterium sphenisci]|uniref:resuscitation-promoting factor n=1 Tax=Corynebacterium sphenisci TaxID=191493 RepID=UPI0026DF72CF|nr:resuscitation-promoting factor [Corynebacterium sphenisci]MDO5731794.1 transglycosylase family protein [Corynebacterium sphenisci]